MAQLFLRPDADQSDGSWLNEAASNTNLFNSVDESSFSDADFIKSSSTSGDKVRLRLSDPGATVTTPMIMRYRCKKDGAAFTNVIGRLFQGTAPGTQIATWTQLVTTTFTTYTYTLTTPEFTSISDFNDLYIEFEYNTDWWLASASVDLWFQNGLYYDSGAGGTGQAVATYLSCSRASTGYAKTAAGALTSFATNALRLTDNGLLCEEARTNFSFPSQAFSGGVTWTPTNVTVSDNATTAPDGTTTAASVTITASASDNFLTNSGGGAPRALTTAAFAFAIYVKRSTCDWIRIYLSDHGGDNIGTWVNLNTGALGSTQLGGTATIDTRSVETLANGWYRIIVTGHLSAGSSGWDFNLTPSSADGSQQGVAGQVLYIWGAQFEDGSFISSYIPTTSGTAVRAADNIATSSTLQTVINNATASLVAQVDNGAVAGVAANIVDSNGTNLLGFNSSNNALASITATLATGNTANRTTQDKLGLAWAASARSLVLNGGTVAPDTSSQTPSSTQHIGSSGSANFANAYIERLTAWNTKLANATLQGFTV